MSQIKKLSTNNTLKTEIGRYRSVITDPDRARVSVNRFVSKRAPEARVVIAHYKVDGSHVRYSFNGTLIRLEMLLSGQISGQSSIIQIQPPFPPSSNTGGTS